MCDVGTVIDPTGLGQKFFQPTSDAPGGLLNKGVAFGRNLNIADRFGLDPAAKYFHPYVDSLLGTGEEGPDPYFSQEQYMRDHQKSFDDWSAQYTDPNQYKAKMDEQMANSSRRIGSQFGNIGLAGSSASIGAMNESDRLTQLEGWDRQLKDRGMIEQIRSLYTTGLNNIDIAKMNKHAMDEAQQAQQMGQILSAAGAVVGTIYGGPAGGAAGSQVGKIVPGQNYTPMGYQNTPQYDFNSGYGNDAFIPRDQGFGSGYNSGFGGSNDGYPGQMY